MEKYRFDMLDGLRASEEKADEESLKNCFLTSMTSLQKQSRQRRIYQKAYSCEPFAPSL